MMSSAKDCVWREEKSERERFLYLTYVAAEVEGNFTSQTIRQACDS
jgi:hypothetical protein